MAKRNDPKTALAKKRFLEAYATNNLNVMKACEEAKIARDCYYTWLDNDPVFIQTVNKAKEQILENAERILAEHTSQVGLNSDPYLALAVLKAKKSNRGWSPDHKVILTGGSDSDKESVININFVEKKKD